MLLVAQDGEAGIAALEDISTTGLAELLRAARLAVVGRVEVLLELMNWCVFAVHLGRVLSIPLSLRKLK